MIAGAPLWLRLLDLSPFDERQFHVYMVLDHRRAFHHIHAGNVPERCEARVTACWAASLQLLEETPGRRYISEHFLCRAFLTWFGCVTSGQGDLWGSCAESGPAKHENVRKADGQLQGPLYPASDLLDLLYSPRCSYRMGRNEKVPAGPFLLAQFAALPIRFKTITALGGNFLGYDAGNGRDPCSDSLQ